MFCTSFQSLNTFDKGGESPKRILSIINWQCLTLSEAWQTSHWVSNLTPSLHSIKHLPLDSTFLWLSPST